MGSLSLILITSNVYAADCNNCGDYDVQCWKCCLSPHLCPQFEESSAPCGKIGACIQMQLTNNNSKTYSTTTTKRSKAKTMYFWLLWLWHTKKPHFLHRLDHMLVILDIE